MGIEIIGEFDEGRVMYGSVSSAIVPAMEKVEIDSPSA